MNMLKSIRVENFKSLKKTEINFEKNSFLIGLNGAGKTTILQVIDFLSAISSGKVESWLNERGWDKKDLTFYGDNKSLIEVKVIFQLNENEYLWDFAFNKNTLKCTKELIQRRIKGSVGYINFEVLNFNEKLQRFKDNNDRLINVDSGSFSVEDLKEKINFKYEGSILSALKSELLGEDLNTIYSFFNNIKSAELLSPHLMKKKARESEGNIGLGGEKLSAFINSLSSEKKEILKSRLQSFFPHINSFETSSLRSGWKKLSLVESFGDKLSIVSDSMHLSDGLLRILAILSQLLTSDSVLIFDEIEDGINQEFVERLVDDLLQSPHQTLVATHSPLLLNYIDDEIAKKSILFVYKDQDGSTKVDNFYDIIEKYQNITDHEYDMFASGEIMQSVNLIDLTNKILSDIE